jgi:hypothetical protein
MITVDESVVIDRPAEDVFAYVSDQTNAPNWSNSDGVDHRSADHAGVEQVALGWLGQDCQHRFGDERGVRRPRSVEHASTIEVDLAAEPLTGRHEQRGAGRAGDPGGENETTQ